MKAESYVGGSAIHAPGMAVVRLAQLLNSANDSSSECTSTWGATKESEVELGMLNVVVL